MMANGGQMPVLFPGGCPAPDPDEVPDILHVCMTSATHLKVLCDIIVSHSGISSIGDVLIDAADFCFWPAVIIWGTLMIYDKILLDKSRGL